MSEPLPDLLRETKRKLRGRLARAPGLGNLGDLLRARVQSPQLSLQLLGRVLLHAALVGAAAGLVGSLFVAGLDLVQRLVLEGGTGYLPLRAAGESTLGIGEAVPPPFRPSLLWLLPALGALAGGAISIFAPETRGGGSDAIIEAFHSGGGEVRRRVPLVKALASILTLGFGGSGGREGPTMQIGGALGSLVGRYLKVSPRERRILLVAGTAAGMAAVFRTPLGAALLAVEVLHRDDFESDALVPAVLASVVAYAVFVSIFGETTLFGHLHPFPFVPLHLPLYAVMAVVISVFASGFLGLLHYVQRKIAAIRMPGWSKPALGGLLLGLFATPIIMYVGPSVGARGQGLGILGGGYGAAQLALSGADWFPKGWFGVELLLLLGVVKIIATSLTVGSGGSAGDFGPSLVIGGILGGAFGRAAQLLVHDPRIDPGAFALVGMGIFYGGLAHVPIASLVMVCELAGSYDLLVPLMLAEGIAFVALRNRSLYHAQVATKRESPAHYDDFVSNVLKDVRVADVMVMARDFISFQRNTSAAEVLTGIASSDWQDAFPVLEHGKLVGVISAEIVRTLASDADARAVAIADDMMEEVYSLRESDSLQVALDMILLNGVRELLVVDGAGSVIGFLDQTEISRAYVGDSGVASAKTTKTRKGDPPTSERR